MPEIPKLPKLNDGSALEKSKRLYIIDVLRGLAIFTMVCANMSGLLLLPHSQPFRWYGSFAAPLFVALSGFMIALTKSRPGHNGWHFFKRSILLFLTAAIIDIACFGIVPFLGVDVLYLIGFCLPCVYLLTRLPFRCSDSMILFLSGFIFSVAPILRRYLGYTRYPTEYEISSFVTDAAPHDFSLVLSHWLVDGWFPVFPWLGFCLFGYALGSAHINKSNFSKKYRQIMAGAALLIAGILHWQWRPGAMMIRYTYSEVFYPPSFGFVLIACGGILLLWSLVRHTEMALIWRPFSWLGQVSLLMYIVHLFMISYVLKKIFVKMPLGNYLAVYFGFISVLFALSWGLKGFKQSRGPSESFVFKFYFGG